jgi:hypothetical protein
MTSTAAKTNQAGTRRRRPRGSTIPTSTPAKTNQAGTKRSHSNFNGSQDQSSKDEKREIKSINHANFNNLSEEEGRITPREGTYIFSKPHGSMTGTFKHSNHPMQMKEWRVSENEGQTKTVHKEKQNMVAQDI